MWHLFFPDKKEEQSAISFALLPSFSSYFFPHPLNSWPQSLLSLLHWQLFSNENLYSIRENITGGILSNYLVHSSLPSMTNSAWQSFCLFCSVQPTGMKIPPLSRIGLLNESVSFYLSCIFLSEIFSVAIQENFPGWCLSAWVCNFCSITKLNVS